MFRCVEQHDSAPLHGVCIDIVMAAVCVPLHAVTAPGEVSLFRLSSWRAPLPHAWGRGMPEFRRACFQRRSRRNEHARWRHQQHLSLGAAGRRALRRFHEAAVAQQSGDRSRGGGRWVLSVATLDLPTCRRLQATVP